MISLVLKRHLWSCVCGGGSSSDAQTSHLMRRGREQTCENNRVSRSHLLVSRLPPRVEKSCSVYSVDALPIYGVKPPWFHSNFQDGQWTRSTFKISLECEQWQLNGRKRDWKRRRAQAEDSAPCHSKPLNTGTIISWYMTDAHSQRRARTHTLPYRRRYLHARKKKKEKKAPASVRIQERIARIPNFCAAETQQTRVASTCGCSSQVLFNPPRRLKLKASHHVLLKPPYWVTWTKLLKKERKKERKKKGKRTNVKRVTAKRPEPSQNSQKVRQAHQADSPDMWGKTNKTLGVRFVL